MIKHLSLLASFPLAIGLAVSAANGEDKAPTLVIQLSSPKTTLRVNEQPQVSVSITNKGEESVTLVQPGDGSESGRRTPITDWSILQADSKAKVSQLKCVCGNINTLKADEVFTLAPGETKEFKKWVFLQPFDMWGQYRVAFSYANRPALKWRGVPLGEHDAKAMERVKKSTECSLVSNEIVFTVKP